jgi:hypothetical protein
MGYPIMYPTQGLLGACPLLHWGPTFPILPSPLGVTFWQVLGQRLDVVSSVLPSAVGVKMGPHTFYLLL